MENATIMCGVDMKNEGRHLSDVRNSENDPNESEIVFESSEQCSGGLQLTATKSPSSAVQVQGLLVVPTSAHEFLSSDGNHEIDNNATTHIVIHGSTGSNSDGFRTAVVKTPTLKTAAPLSTVSVTLGDQIPVSASCCPSVSTKSKYDWDESVHNDVLPVRCKNSNGLLHKYKFGSGSKGKCIFSKKHNEWYTPSEFEYISGRGNSKDWKRSIHYGGRTLQCLVEEEIIQPHSTTCICASCCNDESATGPVRYYIPYKRKKKSKLDVNSKKICIRTDSIEQSDNNDDSIEKELLVAAEVESSMSASDKEQVGVQAISVVDESSIAANNIIVTTEATSTPSLLNPLLANKNFTPSSNNISEQKLFWQLEEMVKMFLNYGLELKQLVEQMKIKFLTSKESTLQNLRIEFEEEKKQALNTARIEAEMTLSRTLCEARAEKEIAIQQALNQARAEMNEKIASSVSKSSNQKCLNCNRDVSKYMASYNRQYCSSFCHKKDTSSQKKT